MAVCASAAMVAGVALYVTAPVAEPAVAVSTRVGVSVKVSALPMSPRLIRVTSFVTTTVSWSTPWTRLATCTSLSFRLIFLCSLPG